MVDLRDMRYQRFGPNSSTEAGDRILWLERLPTYDVTAWRRLGQVYIGQGEEDQARSVAIAAQDERRRRTLTGARRFGRWVLGVTIGHGYRPGGAIVIALAWVALFTLVLQLLPHDIVRANTSTTLPYKAAYAVDAFLPIVDLCLTDGWKVTGGVQWVGWATSLSGWTLSTLLVAAFSRVVRNP